MSNSLMIFLSQLVTMAPTLLVGLGGMIVAGIWWRRAPKPAMLAMAGLGIILLSTLLSPLIQIYAMSNRGATPVATLSTTIAILGMAFSVVRAVGIGLLIAAVFAGRSRVDAGFPVDPSPVQPPPLAGLAPNNSIR